MSNYIEHLDNKTFDKVLTKDRISVVKVYATWCGPCKFLEPHFRRWTKELSTMNGVDISYYQVDNDKCLDFVNKHKVKSLPTILIMVHGAVIYKLEGVTRQAVIEDLIKKALRVKIEYKENENAES
jgi:thioredoxin 1